MLAVSLSVTSSMFEEINDTVINMYISFSVNIFKKIIAFPEGKLNDSIEHELFLKYLLKNSVHGI